MKGKYLIAILIIAFAMMSLHALDADGIVQAALENSSTMKALELRKENTLLARSMADFKPGLSVTVSSGDVTVQKESFGTPVFSMGPSVNVVLPEFDDSTVAFSLNNTTRIFKSGDTSVTFTPSATYSKTISLTSYNDLREDIENRTIEIQQEMSYEKSVLSFKNSVLQSLIGIIQTELAIQTTQLTYDRLVNDYNVYIESGDVVEGSLRDLQLGMSIESSKVNLQNLQDKLKTLKDNFLHTYGIEYSSPDSVRSADLELHVFETGNSSVLLAELAVSSAQQALDVATGTSNKLVLGANANVPVTVTNGDKVDTTMNAAVTGNLTGSNYSVGTRAGVSYRSEEFYPYITVTGTWSNKSTSTLDSMNIQSLRNKVLLAQLDYQDAKYSYMTEVNSLTSSIEDHRNTVSQFNVNADYNMRILNRTMEMHIMGLATDRELEDARFTVEKDGMQRMIYNLQALILENNIKALEL